MATRIRYKKTNAVNVLESSEFLATDQLVKVLLYLETNEAHVVNKDDELVKQIKGTNSSNLKKNVKALLLELGVNFTPEVRPRFDKETETQTEFTLEASK